jgi:CPA2 family monovalent cation:H+ antiporter-2
MAAADASLYTEGLVLLCGAVVAAPLFKKIGLGTVLGYLAAGIVIGPLLRIISDGEEILHFAELGVVLLLFVIGLGAQTIAALAMRRDIFGLGLAQVMISARGDHGRGVCRVRRHLGGSDHHRFRAGSFIDGIRHSDPGRTR